MKTFKKLLLGLSLVGLGIFGTIGYQNYSIDFNIGVSADSTKVDSLEVIPEVSPEAVTSDTTKADTTKK